MNEKDLRDCFAMFALAGLLMRENNKLEEIAEGAYALADHMIEARNKDNDEKELGIAAVKPKRKYLRGGSR
jgi:hypothetical protein